MRSQHNTWRYSLPAALLLLSPFDLLASLGMDMYLPAVPLMADALDASAGTIQLTLTVYLVLIGAGQLAFGPLSDRLGRRPVLLGGGLAYVLASLGLAVTSSPAIFLALRVVQACGASACLVATFSTVRDVYSGREEGNTIYGLLGAMLALVPAVGPILGTLVGLTLGWRAIFAVLGLAMAGACLAAWRLWPETRRQSTGQVRFSCLLRPVRHVPFWLYTLGYSAGMGSFFMYFSTAPWLMMGRQGVSQLGFSLLFGTVAIVMMAAARAMGRLAPRWGTRKSLRIGMVCLMAGGILLAVSETFAPHSVPGFLIPMWIVGAGIATAVSVAPNGAMRGFDDIAGTATAVYFCLGGLILGAAGTLILTVLPKDTHWPIIAYCLSVPALVLYLTRFDHAAQPATRACDPVG